MNPLLIATYLAPVLLAAVQVYLLARNKTSSTGRRAIKAGLNGLLFLVVVAYVWQPTWIVDRPARHALLVGNEVPTTLARRVQDSLGIHERFTAKTLKPRYDSVTVLGQDFPRETLTKLSRATVNWLPYNVPDQVSDLRWKAVVRQGEPQKITGRITSTKTQTLAVRYGNKTLDSIPLKPGEKTFTLTFPAFATGRTHAELVLDGNVLDSLHFLGRSLNPLKIQFLLSNPDFESKTLADWLGRHSHRVQLTAGISRNVSRELRINAGKAMTNPDLLVTEPDNAGSSAVRNALRDGRAVLFINLTNAETESRSISRATGSRWVVRRVATTPVVELGDGLTALPYRFADASNQFSVDTYPISIQRAANTNAIGRVGVSLLGETFPLALSGDSLAYSRIWSAVLAQLYPDADNNFLADAPLFSSVRQWVSLTNLTAPASLFIAGTDTVALTSSPLNARSLDGQYLPTQPGWQPVSDSLAVYVSARSDQRETVRQFMLAHTKYGSATRKTDITTAETVPGWLWLALFLAVLTALWVEPKL